MVLFILSYLGGVLTIFSPCVLPVVPFLFSRSHLSFVKTGVPTLIGMALSFTAFGLLSAAGGNWVIHANAYGRYFAMFIFSVLGLTLVFPHFAQKVMQPIVNLGGRLQQSAGHSDNVGSSLLIGASVGLLWAPCAGPILGLVLAGAAIGGLNTGTFGLLAAFGFGAATSLGVAIFASGKVLSKIKRGLGIEEWIKKALGVLVLLSVLGIALGLDTQLLARFSFLNTNAFEQSLIDQTHIGGNKAEANQLTHDGPMPSLAGAVSWLNSPPLSAEELKGKVVVVDFWTYSCINCLRSLPYLKAWSERYKSQGLVVIGIHTPEFAFEKDNHNVEAAVKDLGLTYPIAIDSNRTIWSAFKNEYWPAHYFIDAKGEVRFHHFGEGNYEESERLIQRLLSEAHPDSSALGEPVAGQIKADGIERPAGVFAEIVTPETYLGYWRQANFVSAAELKKDAVQTYAIKSDLLINQWGLNGTWFTSAEMVKNQNAGARLSIRFKARDLHLVLGNPGGKPVRFRVRLDGNEPGGMHGDDIDAAGTGTVRSQRLYQLIHLNDGKTEHVFEIEFLDTEAEAFAFTFG
ncbi:MAG: cytochrome c biogenesis protein DipZ [Chitinophagaceae bacterium]|nr:cytochrome c biogenesis protein DipZ [Oligoflexus sp.]